MRRLLAIAIIGIGLAACGRPASSGSGSGSGSVLAIPAEIVDLSSSLGPIQAAFDARRGAPRFLALLSPT